MKNTFGNNISITIYGESHGDSIGAILDGLPAGIKVDEAFIASQLLLRAPQGKISTSRKEADKFVIKSGVFNGYTTGTAICIDIPNTNTNSKDYSQMAHIARPSHADYTANCKYEGYQDYRGGGHFSGRITAALVAAGAIVIDALRQKGIYIGSHIKQSGEVKDREFDNYLADINYLADKYIAVLDEDAANKLEGRILKAAENLDSVGAIVETAVIGLPTGVGEPYFDSLESMLSHGLFSIPAIKGVEFGLGFGFGDGYGSICNDPFEIVDGKVVTTSNNNGGINGGISNGMPVVFKCAIKPTPSIYKSQKTVDFISMENTELTINGRHDPAIFHRARVVIDSVTALVLADCLATSLGNKYLKEN